MTLTKPTVVIFREAHAALLRDQRTLQALEAGGVDNWSGYHESLESAGLLGEEDESEEDIYGGDPE